MKVDILRSTPSLCCKRFANPSDFDRIPYLSFFQIFNAEVMFREDCTADQFIDVIMGNRVYLNCLYVYNKIDQVSLEEVDRLANLPNSVVISCYMKLNLDYLLDALWEHLNMLRIYTKKPGCPPDFEDPVILRSGTTVKHVCHTIHRTLPDVFKYALVWGTSTKFNPQRVGLAHEVEDEDVIQIAKKQITYVSDSTCEQDMTLNKRFPYLR